MKTSGLASLLKSGDIAADYMDNPRFEWQTLKIFLTICLHGGEMPQQEIEKLTGWAQSSISRAVARLGVGVSMDEPGPQLIEAYEDPRERRRKIVRLTARGRAMAEKMQGTVQANHNSKH